MPDNDPGPPPLLNYRPARDDRPRPPYWAQALVGFLTCALVTMAANLVGGLVMAADNVPNGHHGLPATLVCAAPLVGFGLFGRALRRRGRWPGFLPGALAGWAVAALVEGMCFAALWRR